MQYVEDYLFYNSGNECPRAFHLWCSLVTLSTVVSRKVWLDRQYFTIWPNLYVCLVGSAGSGKSVAKDLAKNLILKHFPSIPLSASIQSREDILKKMHEEARTLTRSDGQEESYHPFALFVNELANFVSVDPAKMVYFLVDVFDAVYIDTGFKRDPVQQKIRNPYVTMLACTQPDWMMKNLKEELFSGGLGRRLIIVYERKTCQIAEPTIPPGGQEALDRVVRHLYSVEALSGPVELTPEAREWYKQWYERRQPPDDPILLQFHETKHVQLQKVAILLALSHYPARLKIDVPEMETALALLDSTQPSVMRLSAGVGRNVLAPAMQQILDLLRASGGILPETRLLGIMSREVTLREFEEVVRQLELTEQVVRFSAATGNRTRRYVATPEAYAKLKGSPSQSSDLKRATGEQKATPPDSAHTGEEASSLVLPG